MAQVLIPGLNHGAIGDLIHAGTHLLTIAPSTVATITNLIRIIRMDSHTVISLVGSQALSFILNVTRVS